MKLKIYKFSKVTSTNDMAIKLIKKKRKQSGCIYAAEQTKGRGSKGRKWISKKGNLSVIIAVLILLTAICMFFIKKGLSAISRIYNN